MGLIKPDYLKKAQTLPPSVPMHVHFFPFNLSTYTFSDGQPVPSTGRDGCLFLPLLPLNLDCSPSCILTRMHMSSLEDTGCRSEPPTLVPDMVVFKSQLCHWSSEQPWMWYFTSLSLRLHTCVMGMLPTWQWICQSWYNIVGSWAQWAII